ncbi:hypothetical protein C2G38_2219588 [Gigaspora rosea]|uniref:Uncharacterized protein n=1 Tax=Gigaspora rosea TaxID=44941 RepID=A0A397U5A7_9GLOM|nr:hypothetical protein C2G38_2219588 [Gigaspora rosea]
MDDDFENNDSYIFELIRNIKNEIENEVRDITDVDSDEVEDEAANETEEETSDETEEETINVKNKKKINHFMLQKKYDLSIERLSPQSHYPEYHKDKGFCVWCYFKTMAVQEKHNKNSPRDQVWCKTCNVSLCLNKQRPNCFIEYHEYK